MSINRWLVSAALLMSAAIPTSALADSTIVTGNVAQSCSISSPSTVINFGSLSNQGGISIGTPSISINYYCNVPYDLSYTSANGRLINTDVHNGAIGPETGPNANKYDSGGGNFSPTFFAALDYVIGNPLGQTALMSAGAPFVAAANLPPKSGSDLLYFTPHQLLPGQYLTAGHYQDTFTISITPRAL